MDQSPAKVNNRHRYCCFGLVLAAIVAIILFTFRGSLEKIGKPVPKGPCNGQICLETKPLLPGEKFNYGEVLHMSILFYEVQRAGKLPKGNRVPWKTDSALNDGKDIGVDLSGGWYDAGDFLKFTNTMAWSSTLLTWGLIKYWDVYEATGELNRMLDCIKWPLDYMIKAHVGHGEFVVQVGNGLTDHSVWAPAGPATRTVRRPTKVASCEEPASNVVSQAVAALAAGSIAFAKNGTEENYKYAGELLYHAKELMDFAVRCPGTYNSCDAAGCYYKDQKYEDDMAWAASWLYYATWDEKYLKIATDMYPACCTMFHWGSNLFGVRDMLKYDNSAPAVQLLLYQLTKEERFKNDVRGTLNYAMELPKTPKGLTYQGGNMWGVNRYAANSAMVALMAADEGIDPDYFRGYGEAQMHYILGDCCGGVANSTTGIPQYSYVVGFGKNYPKAIHHRQSSCPYKDSFRGCTCSGKPNPNVVFGALVGGPNENDKYFDRCDRDYYIYSEVAIDYNAGFTTAVAALRALHLRNMQPKDGNK